MVTHEDQRNRVRWWNPNSPPDAKGAPGPGCSPRSLQGKDLITVWCETHPEESKRKIHPRKPRQLEGKELVRCRGKRLLGLCKTYYGMF